MTREQKRRRQYWEATVKGLALAAGIFAAGALAGSMVAQAEDEVTYAPSIDWYSEAQAEKFDCEDFWSKVNTIENCEITYYCAERYNHICGWGLGITATGAQVKPGEMVAVDTDVIPLHATVYIDYGDGKLESYKAEDVGGAIKGNHIDVMLPTHAEALEAGKTTATVYWTEE